MHPVHSLQHETLKRLFLWASGPVMHKNELLISVAFLRQWQIIGSRNYPEYLPLIAMSSSTLWRMVKAGKFPKPRHISPGITAWSAQEVHDWLSNQSQVEVQK